MRYYIDLNSEADTIALGEKIAKNLKKGAFIALSGDLGAGKTVFVKGLAKGLDIKERIVSPTYTIMCQYFGNKELYHFDLYRITEDDCYESGFDDFFFDENAICAVEWSERLTSFPENKMDVIIEKTGVNTRKATVIDDKNLLKNDL